MPATAATATETTAPFPLSDLAIRQADGFVVVSTWLPSRFAGTRYSYEYFETLAKAVTYHRRVVAGLVRDEAPKGIFATRDGLPVGGPLAVSVIEAVQADPSNWRPRGLREYAPNSPESKALKEAAIHDGTSRRVA